MPLSGGKITPSITDGKSWKHDLQASFRMGPECTGLTKLLTICIFQGQARKASDDCDMDHIIDELTPKDKL
ncbi:hypothetical protein ColTof4_12264 [Colletotrichum tofieldiae]|nr:hypothetical protein ColTof4_12264 [Colletotrichum tofieldiae]